MKNMPIGILFSCIILLFQGITMSSQANDSISLKENNAPQYLYKVIALQDWEKSQFQTLIILAKEDQDFIHLATKDQLNRILDKYWSNVPVYVVLKVKTNELDGRLVYEANPGGTNKYYHLYDGSIPLKAVVEAKKVKSVSLNWD